jgi:transposase
MFAFPASVRIYVAAEPIDLRRGFDGLSATTRTVIGADPLSGHVFCFLNRRKNRIKLLLWDRTGWLLLYKRLERGTFHLARTPPPGARHVEVDAGELALLLEGLDLRGARRRPRWYRSPHASAQASAQADGGVHAGAVRSKDIY